MTTLALAPRKVIAREGPGGVWTLASPLPLSASPSTLWDLFDRAASLAPDRDFLVAREGEGLRRVRYGQARAAALAIAQMLVQGGHDRGPVLALSGNSVEHALLMLACFCVGAPFVPVSPAYSLMSRDFAKLRRIGAKVRPRVVYAEALPPFAAAIDALACPGARVVDGAALRAAATDPALRASSTEALARAARVTPAHVAKILFTSGSTGFPKGVPNTHRMLVANQAMIAALWPFLADEPPVLVDWLPWSHTFGGNHNFNMVLWHAGSLFVDEGKPTEALVGATIRNHLDVSPTLTFNVPAGYAALVPRLESDPALRRAYFARLRVLFYAAAALPEDLWQRLRALAAEEKRDVFFTTAWGSTETSPLATSAHFPLDRAGNIGLPAPGVTLKLVPSGTKLEVRVKGPSVMDAYLDEPELTRAAFDEEGFYRIGDAVRFADPSDPSRGLLFDGRVAEDFKLATGTWVSTGMLRTGVLAAAAPALADLVVAGQDRDAVGVLAWPSPAGCLGLVGEDLDLPRLAARAELKVHLRTCLDRWNAAHPESSTRIARLLLLTEPASIDAGEITDKGYVNQRATLERRAALVDRLFHPSPDEEVLSL